MVARSRAGVASVSPGDPAPGVDPMTLIWISRMARPMVELARLPGPSMFPYQFIWSW